MQDRTKNDDDDKNNDMNNIDGSVETCRLNASDEKTFKIVLELAVSMPESFSVSLSSNE